MPDYNQLATQLRTENEQQLSTSLYSAADTNPDEEAGLRRLSQRSGVPLESLRLQPGRQEAQRVATAGQYADLVEKNPALADWLAQPTNARIAHDDTDNMGVMETLVNSFRRGIPSLNEKWRTLRAQNAQSGLDTYTRVDARLAAGEDPLAVLREEGEANPALVPFPGSDKTPEQALAFYNDWKQQATPSINTSLGEQVQGIVGARADRAAIPLPPEVEQIGAAKTMGEAWDVFKQRPARTIAAIGPESLVQSLPGLVAGALTKSPSLAALMIGGNSAATDYSGELLSNMQQLGVNVDDPQALAAGLQDRALMSKASSMAAKHAAVVGTFDALSGGIASKSILPKDLLAKTPFIKELVNIAAQTPVQAALGAAGEAGGSVAAGKEINPGDVLLEAVGEGFGTPGEVLTTSAGRIRDAYQAGAQRVTDAHENGATLGQLVEAVTNSRLRERAPEALADFLQKAAEANGSAPTEVYIDARALSEALNQSGVDTAQIMSAAPALAEQFGEAVATGGDVIIPIGQAVAAFSGTPLAQTLVQHSRVDADALSLAEAGDAGKVGALFQQQADQIMQQEGHDSPVVQSGLQVYESVLGQLNTAGRFTPEVNKQYAKLLQAFYTTTAGRMGQTAEQFMERYNLRIGAQLPGNSQGLDQGEIQMVPNKKGDYLQAQSPAGSVGGTVRDGALRINFADVDPGQRGKGEGKKLYRALIDDALAKGLRVFSDSTVEASAVRVYDSLERAGYTVRRMASGTLEDGAVFGRGAEEPAFEVVAGPEFSQSTPLPDTLDIDGQQRPTANSNGKPIAQTEEGVRNFWRWFGDSKVVDDQGRPLVVYHGTMSTGIHEFLPDGGNVDEGAKSLKLFREAKEKNEKFGYMNFRWGSFFSPHPQYAGNYTGENKGVMYPAYIKAENPIYFDQRTSEVTGTDPNKTPDALILPDGGKINEIAVIDPTQVKSAVGNDGTFDANDPSILSQSGDGKRGAFNPETLTMTLLKAADLTTFLHESGHFFLTVYEDLAKQTDAPAEIQNDVDAVLKWMGVEATPNERRIDVWDGYTLEQKRAGHERFAESFEEWMFKGEAPSLELQSVFQRFRSWVLRAYKSLTDFQKTHKFAALNPEITQVFSRMLASEEQIKTAEQARSMLPHFATPEEAGMSPGEFAEYQRAGQDATGDAAASFAARGLRDMKWMGNAKTKALRQLQKRAKAMRVQTRAEVAREVWSQPVYQAWQFLTAPLEKGKTTKPKKSTAVDASQDSLLTAIAKLGGLNKAQIMSEWGADPKAAPQSGVFGKPVWRIEGGKDLDDMAQLLSDYGYLSVDENGKVDTHEFEDVFDTELRGTPVYSFAYDYHAQEERDRGPDFDPDLRPAGRLGKGFATVAYGANSPTFAALQTRGMLVADGLEPDLLAEAMPWGFTSGDELMRTLAGAPTPESEIEALTDQRMLENHGELASPQDIERAAEAAIHNEVRAKVLATELAALSSAVGKAREIRAAAKGYAAQIIARVKLRDLKPNRYATAEARAGRASIEALAKGDREQAAAEKRNQVLNNAVAKAAHEAVDEIRKGVGYLKGFNNGSSKTLDAEYLDQIHTLLEKFDLRDQSLRAIDKFTSLRSWVQSRLKAGELPDVAETLLSPRELAAYRAEIESRDEDGELVYEDDEERIKLLADAIDRSAKRSHRELTVEEFRGLLDTVKSIEHLGRLKHKILTARDQANYEVIRDDIAGGIEANANQSGKNTRTANDWLGKKLQGIKQFGAAHIKVSTWARIMDGGKDNGPVWRYLVQPANERASMETTMRAQATVALDAVMRPLLDKVTLSEKSGKGRFFPSIGDSLNWQERFAIALNVGNESNLQRLLGGKGWTMEQIQPILRSLTAEEWAGAQAIWDHFETYRPQIAAKELRVSGKEPVWIESRPISMRTADGQTVDLRGGYYPVVFDPRVNQKAAQHSAAEEAKNLMKAAYSAATTRRGFTKERVQELHGRPLLLNLQGLYSGVQDVIHDLAWHEWVIDANRLLKSKTIDAAIRDHYGPEVKKEFERWRDDIVAGPRRLNHAIEQAAGWARQGVSASGLSFNVMSAAMQPLGITQSIVRVGATWVGKGMARYVSAPILATREVNEKSEWMRNRSRTRFRELNELRNQVQGQTAGRELLGRYGYFMMMKMQQTVDVPTWWGQYEKSIADGLDEQTAVNLADQAVKDAQGGGEEVDQSGVERGGPLVKLFTVFYSFMNTAANVGYGQLRTESSKARLAVNLLLLYTVPAIMGALLKDALTPGDADDEDPTGKLVAQQMDYLIGLVAFGREFSAAAKAAIGEGNGMGYSGPAGLRVVGDAVKVGQQVNQGQFDDSFRKAFINLAGDLFGLPAAQINRTITGTKAISEGKTANPGAVVFGYQGAR